MSEGISFFPALGKTCNLDVSMLCGVWVFIVRLRMWMCECVRVRGCVRVRICVWMCVRVQMGVCE